MNIASNQTRSSHFVALGAISMFIAIAAGAFGAHSLKQILSLEMLVVYRTAVEYQIYHSLGLILVGLLPSCKNHLGISVSGWLMLVGIVIFSGSLYTLSLSGIRWLGAITPMGGLCFLAAWLNLAWQTFSFRA